MEFQKPHLISLWSRLKAVTWQWQGRDWINRQDFNETIQLLILVYLSLMSVETC